ncbi:MAG: hypothetical protein JNJ80_01430 [Gemmatimonadetes bacterium]|nr:hypothetical protein [Gemmatimonadota bacterium]
MSGKAWLMVGVVGSLAALGCSLGEQVDTDAPVVGISSPKADSTVSGTVAFSAQVLDGYGVAKVEFLVDGVVVGEDLTAPYSYSWNTRAESNGPHGLRAQATDPSGNVGFASISVTVDNTRQ